MRQLQMMEVLNCQLNPCAWTLIPRRRGSGATSCAIAREVHIEKKYFAKRTRFALRLYRDCEIGEFCAEPIRR